MHFIVYIDTYIFINNIYLDSDSVESVSVIFSYIIGFELVIVVVHNKIVKTYENSK